MNKKLVSIVVPVKNEAGNILPIVHSLKSFKYHYEIIFVVGASTDGTENVVRDLIPLGNTAEITAIFPDLLGKGNAVWEGFKNARGSILAILDGDLTIPINSLEKMIDKCCETNSVICGNRLMKSNIKSFPLPNLIYNSIISLLFNLRFKTRLKDILCGSKVMSFSVYSDILQYRNFFSHKDRWGDLEILSSASICGYSISNVDVDYLPRSYGLSKISTFEDGASFLFFLLSTLTKKIPRQPE